MLYLYQLSDYNADTGGSSEPDRCPLKSPPWGLKTSSKATHGDCSRSSALKL